MSTTEDTTNTNEEAWHGDAEGLVAFTLRLRRFDPEYAAVRAALSARSGPSNVWGTLGWRSARTAGSRSQLRRNRSARRAGGHSARSTSATWL